MTEKRYRQRFTLIELLVVMGIAALLFALLGPAFRMMTKGNAVERCAGGLKLGMERARAVAIANRRAVALLLPNKEANNSAGYKYQGGGYRIAYVLQTPNGYQFDGWTPDDDWSNRSSEAFLTRISTARDASYGSTSVPVIQENIWKDGIENIGSMLLKVDHLPSDTNMSSCHALIFTAFGELKTEGTSVELYFYVAGDETANHLKIRLNKLTGKVEFVQ